jgi:CheY-like chemotaxis protein
MATGTSKRPPKRTILVVDDDATIRTMIVRALRDKYSVIEATDGLAALEMLGGKIEPDLILLDVMMPNIDGLTVAKRVKQDSKRKPTPIIFLTAKGTPADIISGIQAGARHYMTKPFSMAALLEKIEKLLS